MWFLLMITMMFQTTGSYDEDYDYDNYEDDNYYENDNYEPPQYNRDYSDKLKELNSRLSELESKLASIESRRNTHITGYANTSPSSASFEA